ncbi:hypothetical protein A2U01_0013087, partial [Trifolium medium]|nr:hypothetical protein [Trifolium medium]
VLPNTAATTLGLPYSPTTSSTSNTAVVPPNCHTSFHPKPFSRDVAWDVGGAIDYLVVAMPPLTKMGQLLLISSRYKVCWKLPKIRIHQDLIRPAIVRKS